MRKTQSRDVCLPHMGFSSRSEEALLVFVSGNSSAHVRVVMRVVAHTSALHCHPQHDMLNKLAPAPALGKLIADHSPVRDLIKETSSVGHPAHQCLPARCQKAEALHMRSNQSLFLTIRRRLT